jgi:arylsulfatase A-like enzyme
LGRGNKSVAFVNYPRMAKKYRGRSAVDLFHIVDWYPTILALAGYSRKLEDTDGYDQWLSLAAGWPVGGIKKTHQSLS